MSQADEILDALQSGESLTALDALDRFQCFRLAARVEHLRKSGHEIETEMVKTDTGKKIARYSLLPAFTLTS